MAIKLDKDQRARFDELKRKLDGARAELAEAVAEAQEFAQEVVGAVEAEFEGKSDKWIDSERGQKAQEWLDAWQEAGELAEVDGYAEFLDLDDEPQW